MEPAIKKSLSLEKYNQLEEQTNTRYEYHGGELYAMAGAATGVGSPQHGIIAGNAIGSIQSRLKKGCRSELPSLLEYVLIEQNSWKVETRYRDTPEDEWKLNWFEGKDAEVVLRSINATIPLVEFYQETEEL
jgi:Uma2 family endonuclease